MLYDFLCLLCLVVMKESYPQFDLMPNSMQTVIHRAQAEDSIQLPKQSHWIWKAEKFQCGYFKRTFQKLISVHLRRQLAVSTVKGNKRWLPPPVLPSSRPLKEEFGNRTAPFRRKFLSKMTFTCTLCPWSLQTPWLFKVGTLQKLIVQVCLGVRELKPLSSKGII